LPLSGWKKAQDNHKHGLAFARTFLAKGSGGMSNEKDKDCIKFSIDEAVRESFLAVMEGMKDIDNFISADEIERRMVEAVDISQKIIAKNISCMVAEHNKKFGQPGKK
jgi:hypothetical protein